MPILQTSGDIIERMRQAVGVEKDIQLAELLNISKSTLSSWRSRDSVPLDISLRIANEYGASLDWLVRGIGPAKPEWTYASTSQAGAGHQSAGAAVLGVAEPPGIAALPSPLVAAQGIVDPRLEALIDWLRTLWMAASEEERAWLVVELRMLRGRLGGP